MKEEYHILNLGAGVQSTTLYLLGCGENPEYRYDYAVFADTQAEPKAVYKHLAWLRSLGGPPILTATAGSLKENLLQGRNAAGQKLSHGSFTSIPCFTALDHATRPADYDPLKEAGRIGRQCTRDYKSDVVKKVIREVILGLRPRKHVPRRLKVYQYLGISTDEASRSVRIRERFAKDVKWSTPVFPLLEKGWTRRGCKEFLKARVPHPVPRSACTFCPYKDDTEWADLKNTSPEEWAEVVELDRRLRDDARCSKNLNDRLYLHRKCIPLEMVDLSNPQPAKLDQFSLFDCLGMCGN